MADTPQRVVQLELHHLMGYSPGGQRVCATKNAEGKLRLRHHRLFPDRIVGQKLRFCTASSTVARFGQRARRS